MKQLIFTAIKKRWLFVALFILLGVFGYYSWKQLAIEAYPDIADVTSQVVTQVPGLAAEEVEQQITIPIERALNGLPGMHVMRSRSLFGLSLVTMVFDDGVDDYWARQRIQERLSGINLPFGAAPGLDPLTSPTGEIYRYIIESKNHDLRALTDLQNWVIIPKIKQVQGVADVTNFGGITTQYQVEIDPDKLTQYQIALTDVQTAISSNNANAGGSILNRGEQGYVIRGIGLVKDLPALGDVVVKSVRGVPVFVKDLGELKYGTLERKGILGYTDRKVNYDDGIEGIVVMLKGQNPSAVLTGIHKAVAELNKNILPEGVRIRPYLDRTNLVNTTLNTVSHTLLEGIGLVIVVLIIFLGSWRGALIVAITVPISLLIAFILMHFTKIPANLLSLGAIDFGIIVDGAIVMLETILKKREENPEEPFEEVSIGKRALAVAKPILFSTIIIITAYLPLFSFERVEKKLFTPMAFTVGYALLGALAVALLLIPGLAYAIYKKPGKIYHNKWLEKFSLWYEQRVTKILAKPKKIFLPLVVILLGALLFSATVGKDFLPPLDEGSIWLQVSLPPGITLEKSKEMSNALRQTTLKHPEITYVNVQAGRNDQGTDYFTPSHFEVSVGLKPYAMWRHGYNKADLIEELAKEYATMPGYSIAFTQPMIDGVMDKVAGAHSELVVKVFGEDFKETRRVTEQVVQALQQVKGAVDIAIDQEPPLPQLQIRINRDAVARYGLNMNDVAQLVEVAIGGKAVSQVFAGDRVYDVICRYKETSRNTPDKIANLMLHASTGALIPLSQVADIKTDLGESSISREMNRRQLTVRLNLRGIDLSTFLKAAQSKINKHVKYDTEKYKIEWGGQFENQNRAYAKLALVVPLALAIMFLLLYGAFGKFRQAGLILGVVPLALFGGMLALNLRGMTLNVSSAVGFIALFGVAIQNGVILVSHINDLRRAGCQLLQAVILGTKDRFRPVLMTASVAALGLLPASLATGIGSDVQRPLATVIVYGLLAATALTLFVLPALYYLSESKWGKNDFNPPTNL
ncbi:cobalt-zinc-cadmium resistance protein CzcA [Pedobacter sp. AK013]|uniref:efflux RND transporter permease subunit n=1 Tax=Pedobacter sp. AK013 TaxID=2723071 RepID=UPI00161603D5|nr:CusA/CzcA family heavy metal efflux RND transporter [Pedobacter sp. AK013]MBB6237499.1 cobalt-zinc-cadmium resistance protein CzcA [Pedobacter sp. AK013]